MATARPQLSPTAELPAAGSISVQNLTIFAGFIVSR
jgi:hypothetical protein